MKTNRILTIAVAALTLASCTSFLEVEPRDKFIDNPDFWGSENMVATYCNGFYSSYKGYGQDANGDFYFTSLSDDQCDPTFENWTFTTVPGTSTQWSSHWTEIRRANYAINGLTTSDMAPEKQAPYMAIARLNRAYHYFELVKRYGDVQWQNKPVLSADPKDPYVQGIREDRDMIIDSVMNDIDYAIEHLAGSNKYVFNADMALAMKADICLYEGSYCKYRTAADNDNHDANPTRANKYFQLCVEACEALMPNYTLNDNYITIYNSIDLSGNTEAIFARKYVKDALGHSTVDYTRGSTTQRGITKDAINAFLFLDGTDASAHPGEDKPELVAGNYTINTMLAKRDGRLAILVDSVLCFRGHTWSADPAAQLADMTSSTGYTIHKYDNPALGDKTYRNEINKGYTDAPIYWLAVIYLNYAEALKELGTGTNAQYDNSINKLLVRAGFPTYRITASSSLDEIRRCRRCELMTDKGYRYWDLVRWHQLDKLATDTHPDIVRGAYLQDVADLDAEVVLEGGYIRGIGTSANRTWDKKYYFYPIPSEQITLSNGACKQNPGW